MSEEANEEAAAGAPEGRTTRGATAGTRPEAGRHPLSPVFDPESIAVVGASADPAKRGHQILRALGEAGYRGRVYPVNPKGGSILGQQVVPSVRSLPEPVDLAVLCTPGSHAPELVRECGARGVRAAIVLAVGFAEAGPEGADLERRLVEAAREHGVRVVGPNTSGLLNLHTGANLIGARGVRPGSLSLLVQSGNMALSLMNEATAKSWEGISRCIGLGNEADVGFAEALEYLGHDEDTRCVVVYAEGIRDPRRFLEVAARVTRSKPIVMVKAARTEAGATSARSHTGAVAGPYERLSAGLAQVGIAELRRTDEILHVAETLANQPPTAPGTGIAILSDGGGQGVLAVDTLADLGVGLASLGETTRSRLRALLGPAAAVTNPVDLAGAADADPLAFARALDGLADDDTVGAVLVIGLFGGYGIRFTDRLTRPETEAASAMADRMRRAGKGLVVHSMYAAHRSPPLEALGLARVPVVESLETACRCVAELERQARRRGRPPWSARTADAESAPVVSDALAAGRSLLAEPDARSLLAGYGVAFPPSVVVRSGADAGAALEAIGTPAVLKLVSHHIVHKSDIGGVVLDIRTAADARHAFEEATRSARSYAVAHGSVVEEPAALMTRMADPPLAELLVGGCRDPGLGPVLTLGAGGRAVEVLRDVAHRVLPVDAEEVRGMLLGLRLAPLLGGVRGSPMADLEPVVEVALALASCLERVREVTEIEVNPLFVYEDRVIPIDARVLLAGSAAR